ncbi:helicase-associated domain-containing protein [Brachybacterium phenoliresistens]
MLVGTMPAQPRSLADALRTFTDEQLQHLLDARQDLLAPLPQGIGPLAARAASAPSTQRALLRLDRPALQVVEALAVLPEPVRPEDLAPAVGADPQDLAPVLERLRGLALVWGTEQLRLVRALREGLRHPAGLAPALEGDPSDQEAAELVERARRRGPEIAAALEALAWGPARLEAGQSPLAAVLAQARVAVPGTGDVLRIPRSVHRVLREGRVHRRLAAEPPRLEAVEVRERFAGSRTAQAVDAAFEALRIAGTIGRWDAEGPGVLTRGGLPQRELRRLAEEADAPLSDYVTVLQSCWTAGLVGHDGLTWQPTRDWDLFLERSAEQRWAELVLGWCRSEDLPSLVGTSDAQGPVRPALSAVTRRPGCRARRRSLLDLHARLRQDRPDAAAEEGSLVEALAWHHPLVPRPVLEQEVTAFRQEAAALGLVLAGVLSELGAALAEVEGLPEAEADARLVEALARHAPAPVDEVLLDADLTAVIPGRPSPRLAVLEQWTEPVSRGGGLTLRFTPQSVRRALDAGADPDALQEMLAEASRTPVPQAFEMLLRDERRRHGRVAVIPAVTAVSAEAEVLSIVVSHPEAASLDLHRIAPTVAVTMSGPAAVMRAIERTGLSGVAVGRDGTVSAPERIHRLPGAHREDTTDIGPELPLDPAEAVLRIRAADAGETAVPVADRLLDAIARSAELRIGIVDGRGGIAVRQVLPLALDGGRLRARDAADGEEFTVLVHRVTLG